MADNTNKVTIKLEVDDQGTVKIKQHGDETVNTVKRSTAALDVLKSKWLEVLAVYASIRGAVALFELGTKVEQIKDSFHTVAGSMKVDGDTIISEMKRVSYSFVDETDLMLRAQRGLVQGLSPQQIIDLAQAARVAARFMGVDVSESFDRILEAVTSLQTRGLKAAFTVDQQSAVESYARKLGVTTAEISEFGRMQAITNAIIDESKRKLEVLGGTLVPTTSEKFQQIKSAVQELKETAGTGLVVALSGVNYSFQVTASGIMYTYGAIMKFLEAERTLVSKTSIFPGKRAAAGVEADVYRIAAEEAFKDAGEFGEKAGKSIVTFWDAYNRSSVEAAKSGGAGKAAIGLPSWLDPEAVRKANEDRLKMQRDFQVKELGLGNETISKKLQILDLEEKDAEAAAKKIGAGTLAITNYYAAARLQVIKDWNEKIGEAFVMPQYETPPDAWEKQGLNFLNDYQKGLLNLEKEYSSLKGNVYDQISVDKQLEDLEIKGLREQGKLTDDLLVKMRMLGDERRRQMLTSAETEWFKYPVYEAPDTGWETAGKGTILERAKFLIDLRKGYASVIQDTQLLILLDKEEEENYVATQKNKIGLTQQEEDLIRKTGEQRRYQMTIEYQFYQNISGVWGSHLASMLKGAESLNDGLKGIFKDMSDYFISMVSKMAMNWLFFENIQGGGKFLGGGSGLGQIVGWAGGIVGSAAAMGGSGSYSPSFVYPFPGGENGEIEFVITIPKKDDSILRWGQNRGLKEGK